jgi:hypothetical protein
MRFTPCLAPWPSWFWKLDLRASEWRRIEDEDYDNEDVLLVAAVRCTTTGSSINYAFGNPAASAAAASAA